MFYAPRGASETRYTDNAEAYRLYLTGRYLWAKRTDEGFRKRLRGKILYPWISLISARLPVYNPIHSSWK
jgi:hypothetical protein